MKRYGGWFSRAFRRGLVVLGLLGVLPHQALGQTAGNGSAAYPAFSTPREVALFGVGAGLLVAGILARKDARPVPVGGLSPALISWSVDRRIIGNRSLNAHLASNRTRNVAMLLPLALSLAVSGEGERLDGLAGRTGVYAEAMLISQGVTGLGKAAFGRARPYTYLPAADRPGDPAYDTSARSAFFSMPSGHSASAWTGASVAITEYLISRPDAGWVPRAGIGLVGAALAGATSALRVEAGQHFPSDVLIGALVGAASGVSVSLMHRGSRAAPSGGAWLEAAGGTAAGTLLGILLARRY